LASLVESQKLVVNFDCSATDKKVSDDTVHRSASTEGDVEHTRRKRIGTVNDDIVKRQSLTFMDSYCPA
jgi:hypothetical protein